jgi:hypothetical protein
VELHSNRKLSTSLLRNCKPFVLFEIRIISTEFAWIMMVEIFRVKNDNHHVLIF